MLICSLVLCYRRGFHLLVNTFRPGRKSRNKVHGSDQDRVIYPWGENGMSIVAQDVGVGSSKILYLIISVGNYIDNLTMGRV